MTMKLNKTTILALLLLAVALATPVVAVKQHTNYRAILRGSNQNPSVETNAHGVFIATLSPDGKHHLQTDSRKHGERDNGTHSHRRLSHERARCRLPLPQRDSHNTSSRHTLARHIHRVRLQRSPYGPSLQRTPQRNYERRRLRQCPLNTASGRGDPRTDLHRRKAELIS